MSYPSLQRSEHLSSRNTVCLKILLLIFFSLFFYSQSALAAKKYALVVGISEFKFGAQQTGVVDLQFADDDAVSIGEKLTEAGYLLSHVLINRFAEREEILAQMIQLRGLVTEEDFVLVYFAGHGVRDPSNGKTYLLAHDTELSNIEDRGIRLDHFMDYVSDLKAKQKLVLLDHCYSGEIEYVADTGIGAARGDGLGDTVDLKPRGIMAVQSDFESLSTGTGTVVIAATGSGNDLLAYEDASLGHGFFTQAILDATVSEAVDKNNNNQVEIDELVSYLPERVQQLTSKYLGVNQIPKVVMKNVVNLADWQPFLPIQALADIENINLFVESLNQPQFISPDTYLFIQIAIAAYEANNREINAMGEKDRTGMEDLISAYSLSVKHEGQQGMLRGLGRLLDGQFERTYGNPND